MQAEIKDIILDYCEGIEHLEFSKSDLSEMVTKIEAIKSKDHVLVSKAFLADLYEMLNKFNYVRNDDSCDKSLFSAELSEDWFYHLANTAENLSK